MVISIFKVMQELLQNIILAQIFFTFSKLSNYMKQEFYFRKTSWGIFIDINIEEDTITLPTDSQVTEDIYLRVEWTSGIFKEEMINWFSRAIKDNLDQIKQQSKVCYNVSNIDFNDCHFQEEGFYYVMQAWLAKRYNFELPPLDAYYDREKNQYIFPSLISNNHI